MQISEGNEGNEGDEGDEGNEGDGNNGNEGNEGAHPTAPFRCAFVLPINAFSRLRALVKCACVLRFAAWAAQAPAVMTMRARLAMQISE